MKRLITKLTVLASLLIVLSACEKKTPTALTDENIAGKATVCGYVTYNYDVSTTRFASDVDVYVDVDLSSINPKLTGVKRYATTTSSGSGYYEVVVPTQPGAAVDFAVSTSFRADCDRMGDVVVGVFEKTASGNSVADGAETVVNLKCGVARNYPDTPNANK